MNGDRRFEQWKDRPRFCHARIVGLCVAAILGSAVGNTGALAFPGIGWSADILRSHIRRPVTARTLAEILSGEGDQDMRRTAVDAAEEFGPDAKELVPLLILALEQERGYAQSRAAMAITAIGPPAVAAVPALIKVLEVNAIGEEELMARGAAARALGAIGPRSKSAVPALEGIVSSAGIIQGCGGSAELAATALGQIGPEARSAVPAVVAMLARPQNSPYARRAAATALGQIAAPGDRNAFSALSNAARLDSGAITVDDGDVPASEESTVRIAAALSLWKKSHDCRVVGWLAESLAYTRSAFYLRERAAEALGEIGPDAAAAVPSLIAAVDWEPDRARSDCSVSAAVALGRIGPNARSAVPALAQQLDRGKPVRLSRAAAEALGQIGTSGKDRPAVLAALFAALENRDFELRISAADAIRRLNGDIEATIPVLINCLTVDRIDGYNFAVFPGMQDAARIRARAARALGELGGRAQEATPAIADLLDDDFISVREAAADALPLIKGDAGP